MRKATVRTLFLFVLVLLPLQYAAVGIVGALYREPWPVLVLPGFKQVHDTGAGIQVPYSHLEVLFADGSRAAVAGTDFFDMLPDSHWPALLRLHFRPGRAAHPPETIAWLSGRLAALYPTRDARRMEVIWGEARFDPATPAAGLKTLAADTLRLDLQPRRLE